MSHGKGGSIAAILKSLVTTVFKLAAICLAFLCRVVGVILVSLSNLFEKISGNDSKSH